MKKMLLIGALLVVGATSFAVTPDDGHAMNGSGDTMYDNNVTYDNHFAGDAGGIGTIRDITSGDNQSTEGVNIFRDKGLGMQSDASTDIKLTVLEPIKIESEVDNLYVEAVSGDELQIGDLGFRVKGNGSAYISFEFNGDLFDIPGKGDIKGHNGFFDHTVANFGGAGAVVGQEVILNGQHEIEVDLAFDLTNTAPGNKIGTIVATAEYE